MQETGGNGIGRLLEATGASVMINNCFSLLRSDWACSETIAWYTDNYMYYKLNVLYTIIQKGGKDCHDWTSQGIIDYIAVP